VKIKLPKVHVRRNTWVDARCSPRNQGGNKGNTPRKTRSDARCSTLPYVMLAESSSPPSLERSLSKSAMILSFFSHNLDPSCAAARTTHTRERHEAGHGTALTHQVLAQADGRQAHGAEKLEMI